MALSVEQIKGRIRNLAKENKSDARVLLRIYMMERFLERVSQSRYRDNFVLKGGMLITSMIGVKMRSTMDIDASLQNITLDENEVTVIVNEIIKIDLDDAIIFEIGDISNIMDEMEYPGIRVSLRAQLGKLAVPLKIDFSTGDVITPRAIQYSFALLLENRSIRLWSYNLETILAEKLQTILARGVLNTRMRDYYDIHLLLGVYGEKINSLVLHDAFIVTCSRRNTAKLSMQCKDILNLITEDEHLKKLWSTYKMKYTYASDIEYEDVLVSILKLLDLILAYEK
ncbi:MAG: nucleotidyl transferase AbiEii/AbiGii toxin family protein [Phascolarctobacterium sp.]|nr:nucleotidyl transferase AbiEii/AbiGii toxin family protein [Phascolarctobacterium sp.]